MMPIRPLPDRLRRGRSRRMGGFTLIELVIVLALTGIVLAFAVPSFKDLIMSQRVKTTAFTFSSAVVFARSEAIKRNQDVALTAAAGGWQNGWDVSAGGTVLNRQEAFPGGVVFTTAAAQVTYRATGRLAAVPGDFQISGEAASHARCISFDLSGLPKSRMGVCP